MADEAAPETRAPGSCPCLPGGSLANDRDLRWSHKPEQGESLPLTGRDEYEAETFPMLGMAIRVMQPAQPSGTYHWETEQEDFLVLDGEGVLIVEGEERTLRRWDFVHCPPGAKHGFAGAGERPFVLLCASSRQFQKDGPWGFYCADETAAKCNASSPEDTQDGEIAYGRFSETVESRSREGTLPD